ncbi:MAG: 1,2-phenylacetyl-CoA epoxidase subunit PaaD [Streptosporangiaceae bacterium]
MVAGPASAWDVAAATPDPELPQLTVADLGILRSVEHAGNTVIVTITPTYSGCPAIREITADLRHRLTAGGFSRVEVRTQLAPPWSSDWITAAGRRKLTEAGIAGPHPAPRHQGPTPLTLRPARRGVRCPRCGSDRTVRTADFGATACKALYRCDECREPFEYVKEI